MNENGVFKIEKLFVLALAYPSSSSATNGLVGSIWHTLLSGGKIGIGNGVVCEISSSSVVLVSVKLLSADDANILGGIACGMVDAMVGIDGISLGMGSISNGSDSNMGGGGGDGGGEGGAGGGNGSSISNSGVGSISSFSTTLSSSSVVVMAAAGGKITGI